IEAGLAVVRPAQRAAEGGARRAPELTPGEQRPDLGRGGGCHGPRRLLRRDVPDAPAACHAANGRGQGGGNEGQGKGVSAGPGRASARVGAATTTGSPGAAGARLRGGAWCSQAACSSPRKAASWASRWANRRSSAAVGFASAVPSTPASEA